MNKKNVVISGINLFSGGTLTIFKEMIKTFTEYNTQNKYKLTCFVHDKKLFRDVLTPDINVIEIKDSRASYYKRMYYEKIYFKKYSQNNRIHSWISAQDITPNVLAENVYTYCHNPMMFYPVDRSEIKYAPKLALFSLFYKYVYKMGIKKNTYIIVQQEWIRKEFKKQFNVDNVLVARPNVINDTIVNTNNNEKLVFLYASQATFFKNFEVICEAAKLLNGRGINQFQIFLTLDGAENKYSINLKEKYGNIPEIVWAGFQTKDNLYKLYSDSDCMIFPSKLETWGLPISEYKKSGKPIILSDLPYAHETIGSYDNTIFFNPNSAEELADIMEKFIKEGYRGETVIADEMLQPYVNNWAEFWKFILG